MTALAIAAAGLLLLCQTPDSTESPQFSVVSIKRRPPAVRVPGGGGRGSNMTRLVSDPRMMTLRNITLGEVIEMAYDVTAERIEGRPDWLYQNSWDIAAVTSAPSTPAQQRLMLRTVLAERCGLICHMGMKDGQAYELVVGKKLKLKESRLETAELARFNPRLVVHEDGATDTVFSSPHASLSDFAKWLSSTIEAPVTDGTGISGAFEISLTIPGPTLNKDGARVLYMRDDSREIPAAIEDQLGLHLNSQKHGKIRTLVIERISQPSEN